MKKRDEGEEEQGKEKEIERGIKGKMYERRSMKRERQKTREQREKHRKEEKKKVTSRI